MEFHRNMYLPQIPRTELINRSNHEIFENNLPLNSIYAINICAVM